MRSLLPLATLVAACSAPGPAPWVEAHRGGAGYWPQNSRMAMQEALEFGFEAIEFDVLLTADEIPVLAHDPWVDDKHCTDLYGTPLAERIVLKDIELAELDATVRCGGLPDPEFPNAELRSETLMRMSELLVLLETADPDTIIHIDLKSEPPYTLDHDRFAEVVLSTWFDADLPHPFYVTHNQTEGLLATEQAGARLGREVPTLLAFPYFPIGEGVVGPAVSAELSTTAGTVSYRKLVEDADADGLAVYHELADKTQLQWLRNEGYGTALWTINDASALQRYAEWPVDALITDYPGDLP